MRTSPFRRWVAVFTVTTTAAAFALISWSSGQANEKNEMGSGAGFIRDLPSVGQKQLMEPAQTTGDKLRVWVNDPGGCTVELKPGIGVVIKGPKVLISASSKADDSIDRLDRHPMTLVCRVA